MFKCLPALTFFLLQSLQCPLSLPRYPRTGSNKNIRTTPCVISLLVKKIPRTNQTLAYNTLCPADDLCRPEFNDKYKGTPLIKKNVFFRALPEKGGGGPCTNLLATFPPCNCSLYLDINIMLCVYFLVIFNTKIVIGIMLLFDF